MLKDIISNTSVIKLFLTGAILCLIFTGNPRAYEDFDYFSNSWSLIGLKDYNDGARITPDNTLQLSTQNITVRLGGSLRQLDAAQVKTFHDGWIPVVKIKYTEASVDYIVSMWATPMPGVSDWAAAFDWPTEGQDFLSWINVTATNTGSSQANARIQFGSKDVSQSLASGAATSVFENYAYSNGQSYPGADPVLWLNRTIEYWKSLRSRSVTLSIPDKKAEDTYWASLVNQLIINDNGILRAGEGFYDHFWIRDGAYIKMQFEEAGLFDEARATMIAFFNDQQSNGQFVADGGRQEGQFDANGQSLWAIWQHFLITNDTAWLAESYPSMKKSVDWMKATRNGGILPVAPADGEFLWAGEFHIVGYDFWNLRGLQSTIAAARVLGKTSDVNAMDLEADDYMLAIDQRHTGLGFDHFPPSWENAGTHWGNTETLWPTALFDVDDHRVDATITKVREEHGVQDGDAGGYVEGTIRWLAYPCPCGEKVIHPYMGSYTTLADMIRGNDEKVLEDFYWYLLHSTATHGFAEGVHYNQRFGWWDFIPHATGASNYAILLRHMLVHEQDDELHLLKAVPDWWLNYGQNINVSVPTHFGDVGLVINGKHNGVEVQVVKPTRNPTSRVVLHLPSSRPVLNTVPGVEVVYRANQQETWSFAKVVADYRGDSEPACKDAGFVEYDAGATGAHDPALCQTSGTLKKGLNSGAGINISGSLVTFTAKSVHNLQLLDVNGRAVISITENGSRSYELFKLKPHLSQGIYFVKATTQNAVRTQQIFKLK